MAGEVYDLRSGQAIVGAQVTAGDEVAFTSAEGVYKLVAVNAGRDEITVRARGYRVTATRPPVAPASETEVWFNIPLLPTQMETLPGGDFSKLFFSRVPLNKNGDVWQAIVARDVPIDVVVIGAESNDVENLIAELNRRWQRDIFQFQPGGEHGDVVIYVGGDNLEFVVDGFGGKATFQQTVVDEELIAAFLRRVALSGGATSKISPRELQEDASLAKDLDDVVRIVYSAGDINYAIFRMRPAVAYRFLGDLFLGVGGYGQHGVINDKGYPVKFPLEYELALVDGEIGLGLNHAWFKAGCWFSGIWDANAESTYREEVTARKVLQRNANAAYRAGYEWEFPRGCVWSPFIGYYSLKTRGVFHSADRPGEKRALAPVDIDSSSWYKGPGLGIGGVATPFKTGLSFSGSYVYVAGDRAFNLAEVGIGVVNQNGVGTFVKVRCFWNRYFDYYYGGLTMKFALTFL